MSISRRFAAIAVLEQCDYALFEFRYSPEAASTVGEDILLAQAVRDSVSRYGGRVHSLERGKRGGQAIVDVGFSLDGIKSQGAARYLKVGLTVYEVAVLCAAGQGGKKGDSLSGFTEGEEEEEANEEDRPVHH